MSEDVVHVTPEVDQVLRAAAAMYAAVLEAQLAPLASDKERQAVVKASFGAQHLMATLLTTDNEEINQSVITGIADGLGRGIGQVQDSPARSAILHHFSMTLMHAANNAARIHDTAGSA